jgi:hypothetical protein
MRRRRKELPAERRGDIVAGGLLAHLAVWGVNMPPELPDRAVEVMAEATPEIEVIGRRDSATGTDRVLDLTAGGGISDAEVEDR